MSDPLPPDPDGGPDPVLPPEQSGAVTRLLREARASGPVPADVAARLDAVLEELRTERLTDPAAPHSPGLPPRPAAGVVDLGARRRRRRVQFVFAAAAVVLAVGVGAVTIPELGNVQSDDTTSSEGASEGGASGEGFGDDSADSDADDDAGPEAESAPEPGVSPSEGAEEPAPIPGRGSGLAAFEGEILDGQGSQLADATLPQDAQALVDGAVRTGELAAVDCTVSVSAGEAGVRTTYDGLDAVLVVDLDSGWARVLTCEGRLLAATSVDVG